MDGTLVDEHGVAFRPFSVYIGCLRRQGYAVNTINAYGRMRSPALIDSRQQNVTIVS